MTHGNRAETRRKRKVSSAEGKTREKTLRCHLILFPHLCF
jgi:hypothetical protein